MKKSIITFGIALIAFTTTAFAGNSNKGLEKEIALVGFPTTSDTTVSAPQTLIGINYQRSIDEIIAQDIQLTESIIEDSTPLNAGMSINELIAENIKITECKATNEIFPLDFKKINAQTDFTTIRNNSQAILFDNK